MGAEHSSKFTPGLKPTGRDRPQEHKKYGKIEEAFKEAVIYVNKNKDRGYCTVGPGNWVKYWIKDGEKTAVEVVKVEENIILCYHNELKINFDDDDQYLEKMTATKFDK